MLNFINEKGTERVCKGFIVLTLGQNGFRLSVQDFVHLPPQFVWVSRIFTYDFGVEITLGFVNDGITPTN